MLTRERDTHRDRQTGRKRQKQEEEKEENRETGETVQLELCKKGEGDSSESRQIGR